jgi:pimeloyl-ACP methyl ester carboxylesterase
MVPLVYAAAWRELLPQASCVTIDEAGHMAPYEKPDEVADAIASFLQEA